MTLHLFSLFIKAFLIEHVYKMDFQTITNEVPVPVGLGFESIHFLFAERSISGYTWPVFCQCICDLQARKSKMQVRKKVTYLPLKLAELLR